MCRLGVQRGCGVANAGENQNGSDANGYKQLYRQEVSDRKSQRHIVVKETYHLPRALGVTRSAAEKCHVSRHPKGKAAYRPNRNSCYGMRYRCLAGLQSNGSRSSCNESHCQPDEEDCEKTFINFLEDHISLIQLLSACRLPGLSRKRDSRQT